MTAKFSTRLSVETLEGRAMPAAGATLALGNLVITGTNGNDKAYVQDFGANYQVQIPTANYMKNFARASVRSIEFHAFEGKDQISNNTAVPCKVWGGGGNDTVTGGQGNDTIYGGIGDDLIDGQGGGDQIFGDQGKDTLYGGNGRDWLQGGTENDMVYGGAGNDTLFGEAGNDTLSGDADNDWLDGGIGNDTLHGWGGIDTLKGGAGNDFLNGGDTDGCADVLYGGIDRDTFKAEWYKQGGVWKNRDNPADSISGIDVQL